MVVVVVSGGAPAGGTPAPLLGLGGHPTNHAHGAGRLGGPVGVLSHRPVDLDDTRHVRVALAGSRRANARQRGLVHAAGSSRAADLPPCARAGWCYGAVSSREPPGARVLPEHGGHPGRVRGVQPCGVRHTGRTLSRCRRLPRVPPPMAKIWTLVTGAYVEAHPIGVRQATVAPTLALPKRCWCCRC